MGLAVRGAFHPQPRDFEAIFPGLAVQTLVMLGFTDGAQWAHFTRSPEALDGLAHPLDRWSRRVISLLAREWRAADIYPNGPPTPPLPFQRLAARAEPVHQSPIGLLIHPTWGLWHAYRGALLLPDRIALPRKAASVHPCTACTVKPCLTSCPVQAFRPDGFDLAACTRHVRGEAGSECRERGCRARDACPVGTEFRYSADQLRFHMRAFLASTR
jgi:hypothetical protein